MSVAGEIGIEREAKQSLLPPLAADPAPEIKDEGLIAIHIEEQDDAGSVGKEDAVVVEREQLDGGIEDEAAEGGLQSEDFRRVERPLRRIGVGIQGEVIGRSDLYRIGHVVF